MSTTRLIGKMNEGATVHSTMLPDSGSTPASKPEASFLRFLFPMVVYALSPSAVRHAPHIVSCLCSVRYLPVLMFVPYTLYARCSTISLSLLALHLTSDAKPTVIALRVDD